MLSLASMSQTHHDHAMRGVVAALGAGAVLGSMYIPYRKAYITGMNPLTFVTIFTVGEIVTMSVLAIAFTGGLQPFWRELVKSREYSLSGRCSADSCGWWAICFRTMPPNTWESVAVFLCPTPTSCGDCSGPPWFLVSCAAWVERCTRRSLADPS